MVDNTYSEMWKTAMLGKSSLALYRNYKKEIKYEKCTYNNHPGSARLAEARSGVLRTRQFVSVYDPSVDDKCDCGEVQTLEHVLFECEDKTLEVIFELPNRVEIALGFAECHLSQKTILQKTKCVLSQWYMNR